MRGRSFTLLLAVMSFATPARSTNPLLLKYLTQLARHPLRTKSLTAAVLCFLQEVLGSNLAGIPAVPAPTDSPAIVRSLAKIHVNVKALKMAFYGFLISAPLSHFLVGRLQRAFAGKTSRRVKVAQIVANNLLVSPVQASVYLASMAVISGATTLPEVVKTVKAGFFAVMRVSWIVSPFSFAIAQKFLSVELWVPFFNAIQFVLGTYFNMCAKQRLAAVKKEQLKQEKHDCADCETRESECS